MMRSTREDGRNAPGRKFFQLSSKGGGREAPEDNFWKFQGGGGAKHPKKKFPQSLVMSQEKVS